MKRKFTFLFFSVLFTLPAFSQNALTDSLIAYYPYDGNANDATGNGSNGTVHGATLTVDRFGNSNSAYLFNYGNGDYIDFIAGPRFHPTTLPVTITAWTKANCSTQGNVFLNDQTAGTVNESGLFFNLNSVYVANGVDGSICDGSGIGPGARRSIFGSKNVNDNQWHFIAVVYRSITDMDIYIDCNYDTTGIYDGSGGALSYLNQHGSSGRSFNGVIDEIRFYHRELKLKDLQIIYSYPQPFDGLTLELPADTSLCDNASLLLVPQTTGNIQSYDWSNGSNATSIQPTQTGTYKLQVYNGCSYAFDSTQVTFENCAGIEKINANASFSMFYSPENNSVQIQNLISDQNGFSIDIYNTLGQKILPTVQVKKGYRSIYNYQLPQNLASGVYFVNARAGNQNKSLSMVK